MDFFEEHPEPAAQFLHVKLSNLPTKVTKAVYSTPLLHVWLQFKREDA